MGATGLVPPSAGGYVIWQGASLLDGAPIVAIATGVAGSGSENSKTGAMIQTWILRADMDPERARHAGADYSICGDCTHRGRIAEAHPTTGKLANELGRFGGRLAHGLPTRNVGRTCYVTVIQAPLTIYRAWKRGVYPNVDSRPGISSIGADRNVRIGSYGDPAAVPGWVWRALTSRCASNTGYTHQWRGMGSGPGLRDVLMASVDGANEAVDAVDAGWRYFRVREAGESIGSGEVVCPASEEGGHRTKCDRCTLCSGTFRPARNPVIAAHGSAGRKFRALQMVGG